MKKIIHTGACTITLDSVRSTRTYQPLLWTASIGEVSATGDTEYDALHALKRKLYEIAEVCATHAFQIYKTEQMAIDLAKVK